LVPKRTHCGSRETDNNGRIRVAIVDGGDSKGDRCSAGKVAMTVKLLEQAIVIGGVWFNFTQAGFYGTMSSAFLATRDVALIGGLAVCVVAAIKRRTVISGMCVNVSPPLS